MNLLENEGFHLLTRALLSLETEEECAAVTAQCKEYHELYDLIHFGELYRLGEQVECIYPRTRGVYALGATDGKDYRAMFANENDEDIVVETNLPSRMLAYIIDTDKNLEQVLLDPKRFTLRANTVLLFRN